MNKNIKRVSIMMIGTGLNAFLGFLTIPLITRIVLPSDYGEFSVLQTYISMIAAVALMGFDQAYVRYYFQMNTVGYKSYLTKKIVIIPLMVSFIVGLGFTLLSFNLISSFHIRILLFFCILVTVFENFTRLNLRMEQDAVAYSTALIVHRIIYGVVAILLLLYIQNQDIISLLIATIVSLIASILVTLISKRHIWFGSSKSLVFDTETRNSLSTKAIFKYSFPFVFANITNWIFSATGKLTLQKYATLDDVGYYSAAGSILAVVTIFQTTFSTIWVPMAMEHYEKEPDEKSFYIKSNDLATLGIIIVGMTVVLLKDVIGGLLGGNYKMATYIFPGLALYPVLFTISETTVYGINFYKKTSLHVVISIVACVANIIGNNLLVPTLGGKGAAISMGGASIVILILRTVLSNKYYKVNFHYGKMSCVIFLFVIFCLYSSFYSTDLITLLLFVAFFIFITVLYKDTVRYVFDLLKNIVMELKKKKIRMNDKEKLK